MSERASDDEALTSAGATSRGVLETVYYVAGIIGLPLIVWQLYQEAETRQDDRSLEFVERLESAPYADYYPALVRSLLDSSATIDDLVEVQGGVKKTQLIKIIHLYVGERGGDDLVVAMLGMTGFLDQLSICVEHELCDERIADLYFGEFVTQFRCMYDGYLLEYHEPFLSGRYKDDSKAFFEMFACDAA